MGGFPLGKSTPHLCVVMSVSEWAAGLRVALVIIRLEREERARGEQEELLAMPPPGCSVQMGRMPAS